jgi:hypothetical protein
VTSASPAALAALAGRREAALLTLPSVARAADLLADRCAASWVRLAVTTLDRFRAGVVGHADHLEALLAAAREDIGVAASALAAFAAQRPHDAASQVEALAFGAKVWFVVNGVPVPWRPVRTRDEAPSGPYGDLGDSDLRLLLQAMVGSGLSPEELTGVRLADVGSLTADGEVHPDMLSAPLAIRRHPPWPPAQEPGAWRLTFLPFHASSAMTASLARRAAAGERLGPAALLIRDAPVDADGTPVLHAARRCHERLIDAGNEVNVSTCRATGDFFRAWGLPGARFDARHAPRRHPTARVSREDPA